MEEKEKLKESLEKLIEIRNLLLKDKEENFKFDRLQTSLDSWIEDIDIQLEDLEEN